MPSLLLRIRFTGYASKRIVHEVADCLRGDGILCYMGGEYEYQGEPAYFMSIKADRPIVELVDLTLDSTPYDTFASFHLVVREKGKTLDGCPLFFGRQQGRADYHEVA